MILFAVVLLGSFALLFQRFSIVRTCSSKARHSYSFLFRQSSISFFDASIAGNAS